MKKTYIVPCSIAINFVTEGMMAQSLGVSSDETMTSGDFLSNKRQLSQAGLTIGNERIVR